MENFLIFCHDFSLSLLMVSFQENMENLQFFHDMTFLLWLLLVIQKSLNFSLPRKTSPFQRTNSLTLSLKNFTLFINHYKVSFFLMNPEFSKWNRIIKLSQLFNHIYQCCFSFFFLIEAVVHGWKNSICHCFWLSFKKCNQNFHYNISEIIDFSTGIMKKFQ